MKKVENTTAVKETKEDALKRLFLAHNLVKEDVYKDKRGFVIITRSGVESIQLQKNIQVEFEVICCSLENVVIKASSYLQPRS